MIAKTALANLVAINDKAGKPAKTVMIVHEDSAFGSGLAKLLNAQLPSAGFEVLETIPHPTPTRDFNNVVLKIKAPNPDIVIPANYYNEYVLLARTMQQQRVRPKAASTRCSAARPRTTGSSRNSRRPPSTSWTATTGSTRATPKALALKKKVEAQGQFFTYEVYLNYCCDAAAGRRHRARRNRPTAPRSSRRSASSTFAGHVMPYGPTKFVNGQNPGAAPANTQVIDGDIQVICPEAFASAKPVYPVPRSLSR